MVAARIDHASAQYGSAMKTNVERRLVVARLQAELFEARLVHAQFSLGWRHLDRESSIPIGEHDVFVFSCDEDDAGIRYRHSGVVSNDTAGQRGCCLRRTREAHE